uniref:Uncharacterized protein n=1 Tax=viral metagenome TaxID=1070528 RepID=A0A6C0KI75_9ZZZZ
MSFSSDSLLSYSQYNINDVRAINHLIEGGNSYLVLPPLQPLGNPTVNVKVEKQQGIDILSSIPTSLFSNDNESKQPVVFETDNNNHFYVVVDDKQKPEISINHFNENADTYEKMKFTKDPIEKTATNYTNGLFITSITIVGLFVVYRMIQKSK